MTETQLAEKLDALIALYGDVPAAAQLSEHDRIKDNIQSGQGFTSKKEVRDYYKKCDATIYNWIDKGVLPEPVKIGGSLFFKNADLKAMEK
ncbi:helix-turn-helix domain-containing protein [Gammaproteobacteria bacterium]|nr:helix-turn-helix domain-containing protein [Gammaproteobacteria bacterium]